MLNGIGPTGRTEASSIKGVGKSAPTRAVATVTRDEGAAPAPAADMAAEGAPIDHARVADLRERIASGTYRPDAEAIAGKMIDLDLPGLA